jgi:flagellar basal body-associated protein FliL
MERLLFEILPAFVAGLWPQSDERLLDRSNLLYILIPVLMVLLAAAGAVARHRIARRTAKRRAAEAATQEQSSEP